MKKKVFAVICILVAVFNGVLLFRTISTKNDGNMEGVPYLDHPVSLDAYEGQTIILVDQMHNAGEAKDEATGLEFWEPLIAKTKQIEKYDSTNGYTWSDEGFTEYLYGGIKMANYSVQKELLLSLIGSEIAYPTKDSMETNGFSIYTYGNEDRDFIAPVEEEETSGSGKTGRERYSFHAFEPNGDTTYTLIAKVEKGELIKPEQALSAYIYSETKTAQEIIDAERKNSTGTMIITGILTLAFLAGGIVLFIKSKEY